MLSSRTLQCLDALCAESHAAYPEGGVLWTYVEAANQAHVRFRHAAPLSLAVAVGRSEPGCWFQAALPTRNDTASIAAELLGLLQADLDVDAFAFIHETGNDDMSLNIAMVRAADNRYFALELWWSVD